MRVIKLDSGRVDHHDEGILIFRPKAEVELTESDGLRYFGQACRLRGGPAYVVVDRRSGYSLSFKAQEVLRKEIGQYVAAIAYLAKRGLNYDVTDLTVRMIDAVPARLFLIEEEALAWLRFLRGNDSVT